jgi:hypothetical protein
MKSETKNQKGVFVSTTRICLGVIVFSFVLSLVIAGCAGDPTKELAQVREALDQARENEVDKYAPDLFSQAEHAITDAENLIAEKEFGQARKVLSEVQVLIDSASSEAQTNMDNMGVEVEDLLSTIDEAWQVLLQTREAAKKWKISANQWELKKEMADWDEQLQQVRADYDQENYYSARQSASKILEEVTAADSRIKELIQDKQE